MQIEACDLAHSFANSPPLFEGLSFTLSGGDLVAVTGPSGSGKSTVLAMLAGWLEPSKGTLRRSPDMAMTWVPQNPYGVPNRLALDHVSLPLLAAGMKREDADTVALEIMRRFALADVARRKFSQISGGEAQRLMLARALATDCQLILVDEPTAQLDRVNAAIVTEVLGALAGEGRIVVIATPRPACGASLRHVRESGQSVSADKPHMRTSAVIGEAWRDVTLGASRALLLAFAAILVIGLLAAFEGLSVGTIIKQAATFRNSGASTIVLRSPGAVNGQACDSLSQVPGVVAAGALRGQEATFQPRVLPDQGIPIFDATPGLAKLLGSVPASSRTSGLLVERSLETSLRVKPRSHISTLSGTAIVAGVFTYPDDGRNPELQDAAIEVAPSSGLYDECWAKFWPVNADYTGLMQTVVVGAATGNSDFTQLNPSLGPTFDGANMYRDRLSRFSAPIAFVALFAVFFVVGRSRRLEYASARHVGVTRAQLALQAAAEHVIFLVPVTALLIAIASLVAHDSGGFFAAEVFGPELAVIGSGLVGALLGGVGSTLITRASDLFRYVKER